MLTMSKEGKTWPQRRFGHYSSCVLILPGGLQHLSRTGDGGGPPGVGADREARDGGDVHGVVYCERRERKAGPGPSTTRAAGASTSAPDDI